MSDLRLQFGWLSSSRFWALPAAALEHSHNQTMFRGTRISDADQAVSTGATVAKPRNWPNILIPADCAVVPGAGGVCPTRSLYVIVRTTLHEWRLYMGWIFGDARR